MTKRMSGYCFERKYMNSLMGRLQSSRFVASASLAALLAASFPAASFAQDGVVARENRPAQQQQPPKPPETPPGQKKDLPKPDIQKERERAEEGQVNKGQPTQREKSNIPAPGTAPVTPSTQQPTPEGQSSAAQSSITQPLALSPDITRQRVGVTEGQSEMLTLQDAITLALKNNLDIEAFREGVQIAQNNLYAFRGIYDIFSTSEVNYRSQTIPVASIIGGGGSSSAFTSRTLTYDFGTGQNVERTGGSWQVDFLNNRTTTSNTNATLTTQFNPTLTFTFSQPLMRNFKIDQNRRQIQLAQRSLDLSDSQFRQRVIEIINQVQRAYWDLVFAIKNEKIARESVNLARTQLENNQKQVEAGTLAPIELRETEAALESRKGDVIFALQSITTAENVLKGLLIKDANDKIWNSEIVPTDEPQFGQTSFSLEDATSLALKNRPELDQMRLQVEQKNIDIKFYENQTKPQVDFIGFYTNTGLAGSPSTAPTISGGLSGTTQGIVDSLNLALRQLNLAPFVPAPVEVGTVGDNVPDRFSGGYFQSLKNLFGQDFRTYQFGVRFSFPWRNRTAKGNLGRAMAESRQLDARQRQLVQTIQIDVRNALQNVEAARQRYEVARAASIAAGAQLAGEQEKFRAGLSTTFLVLQRQNDKTLAEGTEVRALTDYNKALADLQRVTGMTLVSNNVQVKSPVTEGRK
jgi:outer membrane protein